MTCAKKVLVAVCSLAVLLPAVSRAASNEGPRNVVIIGWDGAQRDHTKEMIARNELPNLVQLSKEGAMIDIDVVTGATDTKAGWTQILTGYAPEKSGVYSNGRYQPVPVGYSVFERVEKQLGPENVETRAFIGKKGHVDCDPPQTLPYEKWLEQQKKNKKINKQAPGKEVPLQGAKIVEENGQKFVEVPGKPWFLVKDHMDEFTNGLTKNEAVGAKALEAIERYKDKRFLFFVHFAEPDHAGHAHGENSVEYTDAIKDDDAWTGKIIAKLKELGLYDQTLVYVVVDHGFNEDTTGHSYAPWVFVGTNDKKVNRDGCREDIAPTVLKRFGVDLSKLEPALDGIPLDQPAPERKAPAAKPGAQPARKGGARKKAASPAA